MKAADVGHLEGPIVERMATRVAHAQVVEEPRQAPVGHSRGSLAFLLKHIVM